MDWLTIVRARRAQNPRGYSEGPGGEGSAETIQSGTVRNLRIIGPIDWLFGIDAIALSADLLAEPWPEQVNVYLDSPGGDLFEALTLRAALDALTAEGVRVNTQAGAVVGSAAVPIYLAGSVRTGQAYTRFMVHNPRAALFVNGDAEGMTSEFEEFMVTLREATSLYWDTIGTHVDVRTVVDWRQSADTWLIATEAIEHGLMSSIVEPVPEPDTVRARLIGSRIRATLREERLT